MQTKKGLILSLPVEAIIWFLALILLAGMNPNAFNFISLCPLKNLGFSWCPGCGLGQSVAHCVHGEFQQSIQTHPLGIFAVIVLMFRIIDLLGGWVRRLKIDR